MPSCRLVVVSCPKRSALQQIWKNCLATSWPDCLLPVTIISPAVDVGWNANLIACLEQVAEDFILLMLDDNFIEPNSQLTANIEAVLSLMERNPDIALIKLQAGGAHAPEIPFAQWDRIREYDRRPHPFKRTNLIPSMYRKSWLLKFSKAVLQECGPARDVARGGALEFEITGTKMTTDANAWPERMFGIHRPGPDGSGGDSLLVCVANDAVTDGKLRDIEPVRRLCHGIDGVEIWL